VWLGGGVEWLAWPDDAGLEPLFAREASYADGTGGTLLDAAPAGAGGMDECEDTTGISAGAGGVGGAAGAGATPLTESTD